MKKQFLHFTLHLFVFIISIGAAASAFLYWIGYFDNDTFVAYLYEDTTFHLVEISQLTELFAESDTPFESAPIYGQVTDRVESMIEKGANSIILNLEEPPADDLFALADEYDVTLFFVGALPSEAQISSYDKVWCFTESAAYAGELLGEQVALGFRDDSIADQNEDLLLDYIFLIPNDTYMETQTAIDSTLLELDHYGVYTADVYSAAYNAAYAAAELAANGFEEEELTEEELAAMTDPDATLAEETTEGDAAETEEAEEEPEETEITVTVPLSDLSSTEVVLSIGSANATYLAEQAVSLGWRDGYTPTALACIVENYTVAANLSATELYHSIVYFDTAYATETVATMAANAYAQTPVTDGTDYAETTDHIYILPHAVY